MGQNKRRDPIADYIEWTQHRYDPGYYLGGNLPPHLRRGSLGPRARRRAGILLGLGVVGPLAGLGWQLAHGSFWGRLGYAAAVLLITAAAAVRMFRADPSRADLHEVERDGDDA